MITKNIPFKYFKIFPQNFADILIMSDEEAGARFKVMLARLLKNEAPEGTPEYDMIEECREYSRKQRERVQKRWSTPVPPSPSPSRNSKKEPTLSEVYDFADEEKLPIERLREWFDFQSHVGFGSIRTHWKIAARAFCERHKKD